MTRYTSSSGAILAGFDYQIRFFWLKAFEMLARDSLIEKIELESRSVKGFDDVVVHYKGHGWREVASGNYYKRDYYQCKFKTYIGSYGIYGLKKYVLDLAKKNWFEQWRKLYSDWAAEIRAPRLQGQGLQALYPDIAQLPYRVYLVTNWSLSTDNPIGFLAKTGAIKANQLDNFDAKELRKHLGLGQSGDTEEVVKSFLNSFRFLECKEDLINVKIKGACETLGLKYDEDILDYDRLRDVGLSLLKHGQREFDPCLLRQILEDNKMYVQPHVNSILPSVFPPPQPVNRPCFDALKRKYEATSDRLLGQYLRCAFKRVYPSRLLAEQLPAIAKGGVNWDSLEHIFLKMPMALSTIHSLDRLRLFEEFEKQLSEQQLSDQPAAAHSVVSLIFHPDEYNPGSYHCHAALQADSMEIRKINLPKISVGYLKHTPSQCADEPGFVDIEACDSIPVDYLYHWLRKVVAYLQYDYEIDFDCEGSFLDLYLPLDLLDMNWMSAASLDASLESEDLMESLVGFRYRIRSYDRWTKRQFKQLRKYLREKLELHEQAHDNYALLFDTHKLMNKKDDRQGDFLRCCRDKSVVAVVGNSKPSRGQIQGLVRDFIKSFLPIVAWWHHDCSIDPDVIGAETEKQFFPVPSDFSLGACGSSAEVQRSGLQKAVFSLKFDDILLTQAQYWEEVGCKSWPNLIVLYEDMLEPCASSARRSSQMALVEPKLFNVACGFIAKV